jgi:hypothetical protein
LLPINISGREFQNLCPFTQRLWPKFYKFRFATIRLGHPPKGWKRENRSTHPSPLLFFISQRKKSYGTLAAGIAAVWIGIFGLLVVRLVEYAMALL